MLKRIFVSILLLFVTLIANASELKSDVFVNITSDTAANAKNIAFDEARRQIIAESLRQYVDVDSLSELLKNTKSDVLMNMISSSSIDGEQTSDTTYSANISMSLDVEAVRKWLNDGGVQNWLPDMQNQNMSVVVVDLPSRLASWVELNKIASEKNIQLNTKNISGNILRLEIPSSVRGTFTIAVREHGWKYADQNGELHIWK
jgi:hypothetical protein